MHMLFSTNIFIWPLRGEWIQGGCGPPVLAGAGRPQRKPPTGRGRDLQIGFVTLWPSTWLLVGDPNVCVLSGPLAPSTLEPVGSVELGGKEGGDPWPCPHSRPTPELAPHSPAHVPALFFHPLNPQYSLSISGSLRGRAPRQTRPPCGSARATLPSPVSPTGRVQGPHCSLQGI